MAAHRGPWRKVTEARKLHTNDLRTMVVHTKLECGHEITDRGDRAYDAKFAKKRRCKQCTEATNEKEVAGKPDDVSLRPEG